MLLVQETVGLCSTCNHSPSCYHHATRGPALFCELFDDSEISRRRAPGPEAWSPGQEPWESGKPGKPGAGELMVGLCANCADRELCTHHRPAGGVWHCEDYE